MTEPKLIEDTKNTVVFLLILCILTAGTILVFLGAISPLLLPGMLVEAKKKAAGDAVMASQYKKEAVLRVILWTVISWGILFCAYRNGI